MKLVYTIGLLTFCGFLPMTLLAQGLVPCDGIEVPCDVNTLKILAESLLNLLVLIATSVATIMFAWAGIVWFTSGGSEGQITKAKAIFKAAVIGVLVTFGAWVIVKTIVTVFLGEAATSEILSGVTMLSTLFL